MRWRTKHRRRKTFLPAFNRKYWTRLIREATRRVAEREKDNWPPKYEEFVGNIREEMDLNPRWKNL